MMTVARLPVMLLVSLLLVSCNTTTLQSIWKLRKVDLLTLDPAQVRIALHAPEWMHPMFDGMQLYFRSETSSGAAKASVFRLRRIDRPDDVASIQRAGLPGENLAIFEIEPGDLNLVRAHQTQMVVLKHDGQDISSMAQMQRKGRAVCLSFPPPGAPTKVDIYVHFTNEMGWMLFSEDEDIGAFDLADGIPAPDAAACANLSTSGPDGATTPLRSGARPKKMRGGVSFQSGK